jgi:hypothetical protein
MQEVTKGLHRNYNMKFNTPKKSTKETILILIEPTIHGIRLSPFGNISMKVHILFHKSNNVHRILNDVTLCILLDLRYLIYPFHFKLRESLSNQAFTHINIATTITHFLKL